MKKTQGGTQYRQGDIILIPFPFTNLTGYKKRPAIIVSNSKLNGNDFICSLITSNSPKDGLILKRGDFLEGNLPFRSWIKPERIFTIDKRIILKKLATVNSKFYLKLQDKIFEFIKMDTKY